MDKEIRQAKMLKEGFSNNFGCMTDKVPTKDHNADTKV